MNIEIKRKESFNSRNFFLDHLVIWLVKIFRFCLLPGWCNICLRPTVFIIRSQNLREDVRCLWCMSPNRKRQMMYIFEKTCSNKNNIVIWNTENRGGFHQTLKKRHGENYVSSEYLGEDIASGTLTKEMRHEDMRRTSFDSNSFNIVFSSDDLEHIPEPQEALNEISRVLKKRGKFIFTVPFNVESDTNDVRAKRKSDGNICNLKEPQFHVDPLNPSEGILVYTIFGWDLVRMCREAGMLCKAYKIYIPWCGIIGSNAIIFICQKQR